MHHFRVLRRLLHSRLAFGTLLLLLATQSGWAAGPTQQELDQAASATDTWLMTNKSYDGHRYVSLDQIKPDNAANLREVCTYRSGVNAPAQATPLLYQGRLYLSIGQTTVAVDARNCNQLWRHEWTLKGKAISNPNRGVAIKDGRVYRGTSDGYLIALDMDTGKLVWERQVASAADNHYLSMPAMVVEDRMIYGTAGADFGSRGWIGAFKLENGETLWKFDALPKPGESGSETWMPPEALEHGGGSFWTPVSVDREQNLVFIPVGNPAPDFYGSVRQGANLGTNELAALDLKSGKRIWSRQFVPHDTHDWDLTQTSPLMRAESNGKMRNLVVVSGKDGRQRLVDRDSREILFDVAVAKQENTMSEPTVAGVHVCPGLLGGEEWSSPAYDEARKLIVTPMVNWCGTAHRDPEPPAAAEGAHYYGGKIEQDPPDQARGVVSAMDVATGKLRWNFNAPAPVLANVVATAGGVIFTVDFKGTLYALSADDGKVLLRHQIGDSAGGGVISYQLDGRQMVAAVSGPISTFFGGSGTTDLTLLALP
jgi:alcohol dehydrogenase (cytochrome c)